MSAMRSKSAGPLSWLIPNLTAFFANGAIMTVELVAGRVVSPYIGMSLYTWTSIIGIVMAGMSAGNYLGGWIADRYRTRPALAVLFVLAALGCGAVLPLNTVAGNLPFLLDLPWPARIFCHTVLVFFVPSMFLGAISPVVAKLALESGREAGRTIGGVFAWGVAGSIVGTFLTGFYLVLHFPVPWIVGAATGAIALAGLGYGIAALLRTGPAPSLPEAGLEAIGPRTDFKRWIAPNATVFTSNAAFMVLEIAAMRVIAKEFGASLYTWTTVIGVVLAGISVGNYLGGRLAGRFHGRFVIALLFLLASATAIAAPALSRAMGVVAENYYAFMILSWPVQITLHMSVAFLLPNIFIGMISPVVAKRALEEGRSEGRTVGGIQAAGALGSIIGTFAAGYYLIDWFTPQAVVAWVSLLLAAAALFYAARNPLSWGWGACAAAGLAAALTGAGPLRALGETTALRPAPHPHAVYEDHSRYSYIAILEDPADPNIREMLLDQLSHSQVNLLDPLDTRYDYEKIYAAVINEIYPPGQPLTTFVIGGGGYSFPRYLEMSRPGSHVEAAEIDPAVTEAAFAAFGVPRDTTIEIHDQDARNRISDLMRMRRAGLDTPVYDAIFGDSINDYAVPYHLTTLEVKREIHELLAPDGVYLLNLIDMYSSGQFVGAVINTMEAVFENVYVFNTGRPVQVRDTFVVVGTKTPRDLSRVAEQVPMLAPQSVTYLKEQGRGIVLTDAYAPVENLLAPVVRTRRGDIGEISLREARRRGAEGDLDAAVRLARRAVAEHAIYPPAHEYLAELLQQQGDYQGAAEALRNALEGHREPARAHVNLAQLLFGIEEYEEALAHWEAASKLEPEQPLHPYNMGLALAARQEFPEAIVRWRQALEINPRHLDSLHNLALAHALLREFEEAWAAVDQIQALEGTPDPSLVQLLEQQAPRAAAPPEPESEP